LPGVRVPCSRCAGPQILKPQTFVSIVNKGGILRVPLYSSLVQWYLTEPCNKCGRGWIDSTMHVQRYSATCAS
jgi:hypothetical protein